MKIRNLLILIFMSILLILNWLIKGYSSEEWKVLIAVLFIVFLYFDALQSISRRTHYSLFSDGRFYVWSFLTLYSIWVPILAIISRIIEMPFSSLNIYGATKYNISELLLTCYTSILLLVGMRVGLLINTRIQPHKKIKFEESNNFLNQKYKFWFLISLISTLVFLAPFILGGFSQIKSGGTILDVESISTLFSGNIPFIIISFFFSSEVMTISTSVFIMYYLESNKTSRRKAFVLLLILFLHATLSVLTTRSARFMVILIITFSLILKNQELRNSSLFKKIIIVVPIFMIFVYFIDYILVEQVRYNLLYANQNIIIEFMRRFDGIGPYDALFKAVLDKPDLKMLTNIIYSFFRPIPIFGQIIINILGINMSASPLFLWMSQKYPTIYSAGGGLAYMPQIEAYLSAGYLGCYLFGLLYGFIFGKERYGIENIIVIAMSLMLARGSFGVLATLYTPYVLICYYLYHKSISKINIKKEV